MPDNLIKLKVGVLAAQKLLHVCQEELTRMAWIEAARTTDCNCGHTEEHPGHGRSCALRQEVEWLVQSE